MKEQFAATMDMLRAVKDASRIKVNRNFEGFYADRLTQCLSEPNLLAVVERLCRSMDVQIEYIARKKVAAFIGIGQSREATSILAWLRKHSRVAAMLTMLKDEEEYRAVLAGISIDPVEFDDFGVYPQPPSYEIGISVQCLSPLAHGSDVKAGNATLFRRRQVIMPGNGRMVDLPYYAGNSLRGKLRDILADDLLQQLGLPVDRSKPVFTTWAFHAFYDGGILDESGAKIMAGMDAALGKNGVLRADGLRMFRNMLPGLSVLGAAMGNRILSGRSCVGDLRPCCLEWGNGDLPQEQLTEQNFLTRRDDFEGRGDDDKHAGMIATTECLKEGVTLIGGIDIYNHASEMERAAIGRALELFADYGHLGAGNSRGWGKISVELKNLPSSAVYTTYLAENKKQILGYLNTIGALAGPFFADDCEGPL